MGWVAARPPPLDNADGHAGACERVRPSFDRLEELP